MELRLNEHGTLDLWHTGVKYGFCQQMEMQMAAGEFTKLNLQLIFAGNMDDLFREAYNVTPQVIEETYRRQLDIT